MGASLLDILGTIAGAENELRAAREAAKTKKDKESLDAMIKLIKARFTPYAPTTTPTQTAEEFLGGAGQIQPTLPSMRPLGLNQSFLPRAGIGGDIIPGMGARPTLPSLKAPEMGAIPTGTMTLPQPVGGTPFWTPPKERGITPAMTFEQRRELKQAIPGKAPTPTKPATAKTAPKDEAWLAAKELTKQWADDNFITDQKEIANFFNETYKNLKAVKSGTFILPETVAPPPQKKGGLSEWVRGLGSKAYAVVGGKGKPTKPQVQNQIIKLQKTTPKTQKGKTFSW